MAFIVLTGCTKKEEIADVITASVSNINGSTAATKIKPTSATLNGTVNANDLSTTVTFEYGKTASYENSVNAAANSPSDRTSEVSAIITGLTPGTLYHFRIRATNSLGTTYGNDMTFMTVISDVEGNNYNVVAIGEQVWMQENLRTAKYNNGEHNWDNFPGNIEYNK